MSVGVSPVNRSSQWVLEKAIGGSNDIRDGINSGSNNFAIGEHFPWGEVEDFTPRINFDPIDIQGSRTQSKTSSFKGAFTGGIDVSFWVTNWRHLYLIFPGSYTSTNTDSGTADYFLHTLQPNPTLPYSTVYGISRQTDMDVFAGCWVSDYTLSMPKAQAIKANMTLEALEYVSDTALTKISPSYGTVDTGGSDTEGGSGSATENLDGNLYRFTDGTNSYAFTLDINGGGATSQTSFTHEVEFGVSHTITRAPAYDEYYGDYFTLSGTEYTFNVTIDLYDQSSPEVFQDMVDNEYEAEAVITIVKDNGVTPNPNAGTEQIQLTLPRLKLYNLPKNWDEAIRTTLEFDVLYDESTSRAVYIETQDLIADYSHEGSPTA